MEKILQELKEQLENQRVNSIRFGNGIITKVIGVNQNESADGKFTSISKVNFVESGERLMDIPFALTKGLITLLDDEDDIIKSEILGIVLECDIIEKERRHKEYLEIFGE